MGRLKPLAWQERIRGYTHQAIVTANDLNQTATNTTQVLVEADVPTEEVIEEWELRLVTPFQNTADNAFNSTTVVFGDTDSANRFITSQQVNANGAYITAPVYGNTAFGPYAASKQLLLTFSSMVGKALNSLNRGELHLYCKLTSPKVLSDLTPLVVPSKA